MEQENVGGEKNVGNGMSSVLYCAIFSSPSFINLEVLQDFHALLLWIQKQSNYWHSTYFLPCLQECVPC